MYTRMNALVSNITSSNGSEQGLEVKMSADLQHQSNNTL